MSDDDLIRELNRQLSKAHRKVGEVRKVVETFWARGVSASNPYDRDTAWAMHVALVQLAEILKRGGTE